MSDFIKFLDKTSKIVETWPKWKQDALRNLAPENTEENTMKQKIEFQLDIPEDLEFVKYDNIQIGYYYLAMDDTFKKYSEPAFSTHHKALLFKLKEPLMELETTLFVKNFRIDNNMLAEYGDDRSGIGFNILNRVLSMPNIRDLIKILNYFNLNRKLPTNIIVKKE